MEKKQAYRTLNELLREPIMRSMDKVECTDKETFDRLCNDFGKAWAKADNEFYSLKAYADCNMVFVYLKQEG